MDKKSAVRLTIWRTFHYDIRSSTSLQGFTTQPSFVYLDSKISYSVFLETY